MYGSVKPLFFGTVILYDLQMADDDIKDVEEPFEGSQGKQRDKEPESGSVLEGEIVGDNSEGSDKTDGSDKSDMSNKSEEIEQGVGSGSDTAKEVMNLENMIRTNNSQSVKLSADLAEAREMLKDAFENDATYKEHADAAKDANKVKAATKAQILKQPQVAQIATNVKVLSSELKELKEALSDYLGEYNRLSGIFEIEGEDGELLQIVYVAKLVRKTR